MLQVEVQAIGGNAVAYTYRNMCKNLMAHRLVFPRFGGQKAAGKPDNPRQWHNRYIPVDTELL